MPRAKKSPKAEPFSPRAHPHLYEINTWAWLDELEEKYGRRLTLGAVPEREWDALKELGFDLVWLMGVWQRSPAGRQIARSEPALFPAYDEALPGWGPKDVVGSPYAIHSYIPDARLGAWKGLDAARKELHARGLGLILDFVPNHTALDHPWTRAHPDYYVEGAESDYHRDAQAFYRVKSARGRTHYLARGRDPYFAPWTDTAQLNYFNPATRKALLGELESVAAHCDGLRCDMAMLVLNDIFARTWGAYLSEFERPWGEFWPDAVAALPGLIWLAEVYWDVEWQMQQLGFSFAYDKRLYDRLCHAAPAEVALHLRAEWDYQRKLARFLENHDEPRAAVAFGAERLVAVGTLVATLPGMRFYHQGQFEGRRRRLPVQLAHGAVEAPDPAVRAFYEKLLRMTNEEVFHGGEWRLLEVAPAGEGHENLIAYQWRSKKALKLVVVNLGGSAAQGVVSLGDGAEASRDYNLFDQLNDANYERPGAELASPGLFVRLEAYRAHLFDVSAR